MSITINGTQGHTSPEDPLSVQYMHQSVPWYGYRGTWNDDASSHCPFALFHNEVTYVRHQHFRSKSLYRTSEAPLRASAHGEPVKKSMDTPPSFLHQQRGSVHPGFLRKPCFSFAPFYMTGGNPPRHRSGLVSEDVMSRQNSRHSRIVFSLA